MMIVTAKFSRRKAVAALVICAAVTAGLVFLLSGCFGGKKDSADVTLESNEDRIAYLNSLGWEVDEEPVESLVFAMPDTLTEPYLSYNALQIPQGFDLGAHCGEQITRYTYTVTNYPGHPAGVQANLYVSRTSPVAGDILCAGANGFQEALIQSQNDG